MVYAIINCTLDCIRNGYVMSVVYQMCGIGFKKKKKKTENDEDIPPPKKKVQSFILCINAFACIAILYLNKSFY